MVKGSSNVWDNLRGAMRARARGDGTGYGAIREAADEIRREKEEKSRKATLKQQERQAQQWERKFRDGRSDDLKIRFNPESGFTDIYYGGVGEPDGDGHGHIRVWLDGREEVVREPYIKGSPGGRKDATLMDGKTPDRRPLD